MDFYNYELATIEMVIACVENVGCALKLILYESFVSVTNELELLNSQAIDRIRNAVIGISLDDSFACPYSIHRFFPES